MNKKYIIRILLSPIIFALSFVMTIGVYGILLVCSVVIVLDLIFAEERDIYDWIDVLILITAPIWSPFRITFDYIKSGLK